METENNITLHLNDIRDLFIAPDFDPFDPHSTEFAGLEILAEYLKPRDLDQPLKVTLYLPPEQITPDLPTKTREAVARYCQWRILKNGNEMKITRREGGRTLVYALIICAIVFALYIALVLLNVSSTLLSIIGPTLVIVCWVVVWWPVETLLFNWLPNWRDKHIYQKLMETEMVILPEA
jgi:hypothetical protein